MATLSRAYMRATRPAESIAIADRALDIAERQNLEGLVAEALVNKGSSLGNVGRRREARALLEMAILLAAEQGMHELELRARNNLSVDLYEDDPKAALAVVMESVEMGMKIGQRSIVNWQTGSAAMYSLVIATDWKSTLEMVDDVLAVSVQEHDRARMLAIKALYRAYQGSHDELAQAARVAEGRSEPQVPATVEWAQALAALNEGRYEAAQNTP